jgi:hypothetical protein
MRAVGLPAIENKNSVRATGDLRASPIKHIQHEVNERDFFTAYKYGLGLMAIRFGKFRLLYDI